MLSAQVILTRLNASAYILKTRISAKCTYSNIKCASTLTKNSLSVLTQIMRIIFNAQVIIKRQSENMFIIKIDANNTSTFNKNNCKELVSL